MPQLGEVMVTGGAQRAYGLAQLVNKVFAETRVRGAQAGHAGFKVEMSGPAGPSTADARRGTLYIRLVPVDGGEAIEMATADPQGAGVELRSHDHLRGDHPEDKVDRADYEALMKKIEQFFERQGIDVKIVDARIPTPPPKASAAPSAAPASRTPILVGLVIGVVVLLAITLFLRFRG